MRGMRSGSVEGSICMDACIHPSNIDSRLSLYLLILRCDPQLVCLILVLLLLLIVLSSSLSPSLPLSQDLNAHLMHLLICSPSRSRPRSCSRSIANCLGTRSPFILRVDRVLLTASPNFVPHHLTVPCIQAPGSPPIRCPNWRCIETRFPVSLRAPVGDWQQRVGPARLPTDVNARGTRCRRRTSVRGEWVAGAKKGQRANQRAAASWVCRADMSAGGLIYAAFPPI